MLNKTQEGPGTAMGVVLGFMLGLLVNVIFIPIGIAGGVLFDDLKKRKKNKRRMIKKSGRQLPSASYC